MDRPSTHDKAEKPSELARRLRMSRARIYDAIHAGELPAIRVGNGFRILPEDRDRWLATLRAR